MKKLFTMIVILLGISATNVFAASNGPCGGGDNTLFYGVTENGKKAVLVCENQVSYYYMFYKLNSNDRPEKTIVSKKNEVSFDVGGNRFSSVRMINFKEGNYTYTVGWLQPEDEDGGYVVQVWKNLNKLATIKLNEKSVISNIPDQE